MSLEEFGNQCFVIPSLLFSFEKLQCLYLKSCAIRIPSYFGRFNSLRRLFLRNVSISVDDLHHLILACPFLVKLILLRISGLEHLRISSPRLTVLQIDIGMEDIVIGASACLSEVCILNNFNHQRIIHNWRSFIRCLSSLDALHTLVLCGDFIKILAADYGLENFPLRNNTLSFLSLFNIRFENVEVFRVCLSLLSSCPNIIYFEFFIKAAKGPKLITRFLKEIEGRFSFPELESIEVTCPSGTDMGCTVIFIEFLCLIPQSSGI